MSTPIDEYDSPPLQPAQEPIDLATVRDLVAIGAQEGLSPEDILDARELALYNQEYANKPMVELTHYGNLALSVSKSALGYLATQVINWVSWDEKSREDWSNREAKGVRLLGVSDQRLTKALFEGASNVIHPLLAEAVVSFHSRILNDMWPPEGPVKSVVLGDQTEERVQQAQRVQDFMNYQYTEDMPGAFEEEDAMLFRLALSGSCFKKTYYDPILKKLCSRFIESSDFIVPYTATDLDSAPRYTHRIREHHNTVLKKCASGYYVNLTNHAKAGDDTIDRTTLQNEIDHTEGRERVGADDDESARHTILSMCVDLDLEGFEDTDASGNKTGIALPYIVWVDKTNNEVLRIQRNWAPDDLDKRKTVDVTHYRFMPGLGFYGYGLLHFIGGITIAATGSLNALLDAAAFSNLQGGYRARDARIKDETALKPGEWREVNSSAEDMAKAFFRVPYEEPSETLFNLLSYLDERGQRFVNTTDVMQGDANPNAPVGTTLALIEQGSKNYASVFRRLHAAHRSEFRILARLNKLYVPEEGYPYYISAGDRDIMAKDFDDRVDVVPVSDPAIVSNSQRIIQAQAVLDMAEKHPEKVNLDIALEMMFQAIKVPNYKELLKTNEAMQAMQARLAQLEVKVKEAELRKVEAEVKQIDSQTTDNFLKAMFSAMQAAGLIVSSPTIVPVGESLYLSAGGVDNNGAPLTMQPAQSTPVAMPTNTHPNSPANPEQPQPEQPPAVQPAEPQSPELGVNAGIETPANEPMHMVEGGPVPSGTDYV